MKVAIALLLCLSAHAAQLTFTSPLVIDNITHSSARVCWGPTTGGVLASKQLAFDTTANFTLNSALAFKTVGYSTEFAASMCMALSGLAANTSYTTCPSITSGSGTNATVCTPAGNANSRAAFTTSALPSPHPALPVAPTPLTTTFPTISNPDVTIGLNCSDRDTKAATAYGTSGNVRLIYPSVADQTSANCNLPWDISGNTKSGGGVVVITSSDEASGPAVGVRTSPAQKNNSWLICTPPGTTAAFKPVANTRLVDLYLEPCDSAAASGDGDPQMVKFLVRMDGGFNSIIYDRVNFDGRGYPYRVQWAVYASGNDDAIIDSYFNHIETWLPWVTDNSISISTNQIVSSSSFTMGTGLATYTIPAFTINQSATTGTAYVCVRTSDGAVIYRHTNGTTTGSGFTDQVGSGLPSNCISLMWNGSQQIAYTSGTFGSQSFFDNTVINVANGPTGVGQAQWPSYALHIDYGGGPNSKVWKLYNNFIGATGISVFLGGTGLDSSDYTIDYNDFEVNANCFVGYGTVTLSSSPFACEMRHHFEAKNGYRVSLQHNTFANAFIGIGNVPGWAISLKQDETYSGATIYSATTDYEISSNTFTNGAACFYIAGDTNNSAQTFYSKMIARVRFSQNRCNPNSYTRVQFWLGSGSMTSIANGGIPLWIENETEDVILDHDTFYNPVGSFVSGALLTERWSEGFSLINSISYIGAPTTAYRGIQAVTFHNPGYNVDSTPVFGAGSGTDGTQALNTAVTPNSTTGWGTSGTCISASAQNPANCWDARGNLYLSGCALVPNGECVNGTTAGSLVGDLSAQYPAGSYWLFTGTFGARQDLVGWVDRTLIPAGLLLGVSSPYLALGTDGCPIGYYVTCGAAVSGSVLKGPIRVAGPGVFK